MMPGQSFSVIIVLTSSPVIFPKAPHFLYLVTLQFLARVWAVKGDALVVASIGSARPFALGLLAVKRPKKAFNVPAGYRPRDGRGEKGGKGFPVFAFMLEQYHLLYHCQVFMSESGRSSICFACSRSLIFRESKPVKATKRAPIIPFLNWKFWMALSVKYI